MIQSGGSQMRSIPIVMSAYQRAEHPLVFLKNLFYEKTPANLEDQVVLIPRPQLKQNAAAGRVRRGAFSANAARS
jgi:hypothetical protein